MIAVTPGKRALSTIERLVSELNLIAWHFLRPIRVQNTAMIVSKKKTLTMSSQLYPPEENTTT